MASIAQKHDLTQGDARRVMLRFALPIFFGSLLQSMYTTADALIIGRFAGKSALAAIESVHTLSRLPVNFFTGLAAGATILISQLYGARSDQKISDASHTAILFAAVGGLALSVVSAASSPFFIGWLRVPPQIVSDAQAYVLIYFSGMAVSMVYNIGAGILRALGDSRTPFYFLLISNVLNIALDLLFVVVFPFGVSGAAAATVVSQLLSAALVVWSLTRTELPCRIDLKQLRFHRTHLEGIFRVGLPIGIQSTMYPISNSVIQSSINRFGIDGITAWAVCGKLDFLIWSASDAFGTTVSTFVAQNFGASAHRRARHGVRIGLGMSLLAIWSISAILYAGCGTLAGFFVEDRGVIDLTVRIMSFLAPTYFLYVFCEIFSAAIRGTGDTLRPMIITLLGTCGTRVLWVLFAVPLRPSLMTVLYCYPLSWALTSIVFAGLYRRCTLVRADSA